MLRAYLGPDGSFWKQKKLLEAEELLLETRRWCNPEGHRARELLCCSRSTSMQTVGEAPSFSWLELTHKFIFEKEQKSSNLTFIFYTSKYLQSVPFCRGS